MQKKNIAFSVLIKIFLFVTLLWSLYRAFFNFPIIFEESFIKPVIWLTPIFIFIKNQKNLLQIFSFKKVSLNTLCLSVIVGILLPLIMQLLPVLYNGYKLKILALNLIPFNFLIAFCTATTEEILFRGLFLKEFQKKLPQLKANILTSALFTGIHIPIILINNSDIYGVIFSLMIIFVSSLVYGIVFLKSKNLIPAILVHAFNNFTLSLFF